jgi:lipoprotein-anchoring transpeptidase ErfK/SrfK
MLSRAAFALTLLTGLGFVAGEAAAQYAPPPPYFGPAQRAVPPGYDNAPADDDDMEDGAPPVQMQPLPPPDARMAPGYPAPPPGPRQAMPYPDQRAPGVVPGQPMAPGAMRAPEGAMRPPADVGETTGAVAAIPPAGGSGSGPVALLPPDYQPEEGPTRELAPHLRRQMVDYKTKEPVGTIIIDTANTYLFLVLPDGKAMRYGIGVGRDGFTWSGREKISRMAEWPDWYPPSEMIERQPYLPRFMAGGATNPLGARALYLGKTLYRIHGTNQPSTIGTFVSSGCIRLVNDDIEDLYSRVKVGARVVVLPGGVPAATAANNAPPPSPMAPPAPIAGPMSR